MKEAIERGCISHRTMTPSFQENENTVERTNLSLVHEIRRKCYRDRWYGGSLDYPKSLPGHEIDPRRTGFAFPPATEAQLHATEENLGRPLPLLHRILYKELANGGFGPGVGLRGVTGGYGTPTDPLDPTDFDETIHGSMVSKWKIRPSSITLKR